jgi:hypothetical protein
LTTVVHGDFHAGNAALVGDRVVIIDWSDAAIGNPLIDLVTWLAWSRGEPDQQRVAIDAWIDAWAGPTDPAAVRESNDDILLAGAAYQVISYDGTSAPSSWRPATRWPVARASTWSGSRLSSADRSGRRSSNEPTRRRGWVFPSRLERMRHQTHGIGSSEVVRTS